MTTPHRRGFAQVTKQRSGRYSVRFTDGNGARRSAGRTFERKRDAEHYAAEIGRRLDRGQPDHKPERVTFGVYATGWLANRHVAGRPIKPRTRAHYASILDDHLLPAFGHRPIASIARTDVVEWYARTLTDRPTMRSHVYGLLRTIMGSAVNDGLIDHNPVRIVGAGRAVRVHKVDPASPAEIGQLAAAMPDRLQLAVLLASWCALRFGEMVELRRRDIDLTNEVIKVRRAAVRVGGSFVVTTPKSEASIRNVTIPPHLIDVIAAHLDRHAAPGPDGLLFPTDNGGHLQPATLNRWWYKARASIGRTDLRWHDLRHSGAVLAAATGASLAELMQRLGHSTVAAAMRYQTAARGRDREVAELLSKLAANT